MNKKRNVAIYARVSTEHEAQLSALENQVQYYDDIMKAHPDWNLYDRYVDEGITGTSTKKRPNFQRMMEDAGEGRFDLIITREVSRFARNTLDTLQETRKLKKIGVEVWFTEDNIWTMNDEDGELRLTIMATLAQNESKKISQRVKAGQMISFQNGVTYGTGNILGYERVDKKLVVNKEQAETVKLIYKLYIEKVGLRSIAYELEKRGLKTSTGQSRWFPSAISRILSNPFYCGTVVYRKEFIPDYLEQKRKKNRGDVKQVVVEGKHEPIISKEVFEKAQAIKKGKILVRDNESPRGCRKSDRIWTDKLVCSCGSNFIRSKWYKSKVTDEITYGYICMNHNSHGSVSARAKKGVPTEGCCDVKSFQEWKLDMMAGMIFRTVFGDKKRIFQVANDLMDRNIKQQLRDEENQKEINSLERKLNINKNKSNNLLDLRLSDDITPEVYKEKIAELNAERKKIEQRLLTLKSEEGDEGEDSVEKRLEILKYAMDKNFTYDSYNLPDPIIDAFVNKVVVHKDKFEWYLNVLDKSDINMLCSVKGDKKSQDIKVLAPNEVNADTGRYKRKRVIRTDHDVYLVTIIITEDDFKRLTDDDLLNVRFHQFQDIRMDIYI